MQMLAPMFALFALTVVAVFRLAFLRFGAVRRREVDLRFYLAYQGSEEPDALRTASRHVVNLFEAPVLFYVVCVTTYVTGQTTGLLVGLAWLYVLLRAAHSYVHLFHNVIIIRFRVFLLSWLVLIALWLVLGLQLAFSGGG
jgi:hypothetical protein